MVLQVSRGWIPKYRKKVIYGQLRRELGPILHGLAQQKESIIEEGHFMRDHVHMLISIPPKFAVSQVVGFLKGKSTIQIARQFCGRRRNYNGEKFWPRGYFASTVGMDEQAVRAYIRDQEKEDRRYDQMNLFD